MVRRPSDGKPRSVNCRRRPIRTRTGNHPQPYRPVQSDKGHLDAPIQGQHNGRNKGSIPLQAPPASPIRKSCPPTLPDSVMAARQPLELKALVRTQAGQPDHIKIPSRNRTNPNLPPAITPRATVRPEHPLHLDPSRNKSAVTTDRRTEQNIQNVTGHTSPSLKPTPRARRGSPRRQSDQNKAIQPTDRNPSRRQ